MLSYLGLLLSTDLEVRSLTAFAPAADGSISLVPRGLAVPNSRNL